MSAVMKAASYTNDLYAELEALPEHLTGEIINGRLYTQPRPTNPHALVSSRLGMDIGIGLSPGTWRAGRLVDSGRARNPLHSRYRSAGSRPRRLAAGTDAAFTPRSSD